jgi:hypothetical protein
VHVVCIVFENLHEQNEPVYGHMVEQTIQNQKQQLADILQRIHLIKPWGPIHRVTQSA